MVLFAALIPAIGCSPSGRAAMTPGYGAGVFAVDGSSNVSFSLAEGGAYYLLVATDDGSASVDANLTLGGVLAATLNGTGDASVVVSLAAGNYSLGLRGRGRAALGWDMTNGSLRTFPDNRTVAGFLRPASAHVDIAVTLGDAQKISVVVYDDRLLPAAVTNVTASGSVAVDLPSDRASSALLVAGVVTGNPQGLFGLAWSSPSASAPRPDGASQLLIAGLWIAVPVVLALIGFLLLSRRGRRLP